MKTGKRILSGVCVLLLSLYIYLNLEFFQAIFNSDLDLLKSKLKEDIIYAYLIMLSIMIVQNTFTVIPLILVITLNITVFGFWNGFIWSWITSIIAAMLVYLCVRYFLQNALIKKINVQLIEKAKREGFNYVLQARIFPFIPTSLVNILAGISSVPFKHFTLGTIIGNFIYFLALSLIPLGLITITLNPISLCLIILLVSIIYFISKRFPKTKQLLKIKKQP